LGTIIRNSQLNKKILEQTDIPVVLCTLTPRLEKIIAEVGYEKLSLNEPLAEVLVEKDIATRPQVALEEAMKIVTSGQKPVFLKDYEMLFDPRYNLDILRFFAELSRFVKVVALWCGTVVNDRLIYATPTYRDYHSYNIRNYNIICVI
jgi:hypothetical protein